MSAASFVAELLLLLVFGLATAPASLGVPPLPEDPALLRAAPADTIVYVQWFGAAEPNPVSDNATERLAAEPQARAFVRRLWDAVREKALTHAGGADGAGMLDLAALLPRRPGCIFFGPPDLTGPEPVFPGGAVFALGDDAASAERVLRMMEGALAAQLTAGLPAAQIAGEPVEIDGVRFRPFPMPPHVPPISWAVTDGYLAITLGTGVAASVVRGLRGDGSGIGNPTFAELLGKVRVARPCFRSFVDLGRIVALAREHGGGDADDVLAGLGLRRARGLLTEAGLEGTGFASRTLLAVPGTAEGLLRLADGPPLTPADLALVPGDATAAAVARLAPDRVLGVLRDVLGLLEPQGRGMLDAGLAAAAQQTGVDIERDVLAHLGDTVSLWSSPGQGSLLFSGATLAVSLDDGAAFRKGFDALMGAAAEHAPRKQRDAGGRFARGVYLDRAAYGGSDLWFLNTIGDDFPFAPAWCVTDTHLLFSLFPQMLKATIDRGPDAATSLAGRIELDVAPASQVALFVDAKAACTTLYPLLHPLAQLAAAELQREGFAIDVAALPSASALLPHLGPEILHLGRTDAGWLLTRRGTLPAADPVLGLALPAMLAGAFYYRSVAVRQVIEAERMMRARDEAERARGRAGGGAGK